MVWMVFSGTEIKIFIDCHSSCCLLLSLLMVINNWNGQSFQLTTNISIRNRTYRHVLAKAGVDPGGVAILSWVGWVIYRGNLMILLQVLFWLPVNSMYRGLVLATCKQCVYIKIDKMFIKHLLDNWTGLSVVGLSH